MRIRPAVPADLPIVVDIYNQAVHAGFQTGDLTPVTIQSRQAWFDGHGADTYPLYVAEIDGRAAGWCSLSAYRPGRAAFRHTAEISYYVDGAHRRRGVAASLIHHAVADCGRLGFSVLFALVLEPNQASRGLMDSTGFTQWGFLPGVARFGEVGCGHLIYGRTLADGSPRS